MAKLSHDPHALPDMQETKESGRLVLRLPEILSAAESSTLRSRNDNTFGSAYLRVKRRTRGYDRWETLPPLVQRRYANRRSVNRMTYTGGLRVQGDE
jgi:hypothetical protein